MAQAQRTHLADRIIANPLQRNAPARNLKDVAEGAVLVGQIRQAFDEKLQSTLIVDVELVSAEWMLQFSIENDGKGEREKEQQTEVGMTVTSGKETSDSVSASAGFSGWGFSASVNAATETKTFSSLETSYKKTVTDTYTCPPESAIFVYKRKYKFRCRAWLFAKNQNAWYETAKGKIQSSFVTEIIANQELISPSALTTQGKIVNNPPSDLVRPQKGYRIPNNTDFMGFILLALLEGTYPWVS